MKLGKKIGYIMPLPYDGYTGGSGGGFEVMPVAYDAFNGDYIKPEYDPGFPVPEQIMPVQTMSPTTTTPDSGTSSPVQTVTQVIEEPEPVKPTNTMWLLVGLGVVILLANRKKRK